MIRAWRRMPVAVRFFTVHALVGFALVGFGLATLLTAALLWADPGGARMILLRAPGHPGPLLLLWFFLGLTLGGEQTAAAVMLLGYPDPPKPPPGGRRDAMPAARPVRATPRR
jgi:hypothetical protein